MQDLYKNIEEYNLRKQCKILIIFEDQTIEDQGKKQKQFKMKS